MQRRTKLLASDQGFTLIELLVVILIIGVLSAMALPSFLRERSKAQDTRAKADVRNTMTHVEACYVRTEDYTECTTTSGLGDGTGVSIGAAAGQVAITAASAQEFRVTSVSHGGNRFTMIKDPDGSITRTCSIPAGNSRGGCGTGGDW